MKTYNLSLRVIGMVWLVVGIVGVVWGSLHLLAIPLESTLPLHLSGPIKHFWEAFHIYPWTEMTALTIGILLIIAGWGASHRYSWTQTLMLSVHLLLAVYALVGWMTAQTLQKNLQTRWPLGTTLFLSLVVLNGGIALFLGSLGITEVFSWLPLQTVSMAPSKCEFCGTALDLQTGACPKCEAIAEISPKQTTPAVCRAQLIDLKEGTQFWIEPVQKTYIGRGSAQNDINLNNPTVSRRHAWIEYKDSHYVLNAMHDSNGTYINNALIRHRALNHGDEVRFGRASFQFLIVNE